ncbi:pyrroline-5-carboxylate reductase [Candidatus Nitrosacidococcus tergens]|uniref:Pyrroline-5-carboxylate reductase n=1 Tax=Candidatus Nitrosacidococcus tergens TaxID=553981 RepID=A0A7G1QC49_9GAMM|nr:pyrroline-5-carboxylate reductase [Candidatus Nitrosacidococcus tergens]CAB1277485.1 Pyrroline-5-carboxylate reductase [Candidatus Nitrosacidococcus tergens]
MELKSDYTLTFIGGGNMAFSLISGLIKTGFNPKNIWVTDLDLKKLDSLHQHFGVQITANDAQGVQSTDVVVLAVKPQQMKGVVTELNHLIDNNPLWLSIAAGIRVTDLSNWFKKPVPILRAMPNTPSSVQTGATALFANKHVNIDQKKLAESIFHAVGLVLWLEDETLMEVVTALSGSGPAYFFLVMEAMEEAAVQLGLDPQSARILTFQTALGAAKMVNDHRDQSAAILRQQVTSPKGTTERAISSLETANLREIFFQALQAAHHRAQELTQELGAIHDA